MSAAWVRFGYTDLYVWATSNADVSLRDLARMFPGLLSERYAVFTTWDSGPYQPIEVELEAGWALRRGFAYSPRISHSEALRMGQDADDWPHFCECYTFREAREIGEPFDGPLQEFDAPSGQLLILANFLGFSLHDESGPTAQLTQWFWQQMGWVKPEGYLAEGDAHLTIVHQDRLLMSQARDWLEKQPPR